MKLLNCILISTILLAQSPSSAIKAETAITLNQVATEMYHVIRDDARSGMGGTGGASFAVEWPQVTTQVKASLATTTSTLTALGISDAAVTTYLNGTEPQSISDVAGLAAAVQGMKAKIQ